MKRLAIFLITIFTMFSCEDLYKDNGCIEMYEGNSSGNTQSNSQSGSQDNYQNSYTVYFYPEAVQWDEVYVYSWDSNSNKNNGTWPGEKLYHSYSGWYEATVPYPNVIFSNSAEEQTISLIVEENTPYCLPSSVIMNSNNIDCYWWGNPDYSPSPLPNYCYYFYNGNLNWESVNIEYQIDTGIGIKTLSQQMVYNGNNWYRIETIYPTACFSGASPSGHFARTETVYGGYYDYFVPDENYESYSDIPVSGYYSMPDL